MRTWIVWAGVALMGGVLAPAVSAQSCMQCENSGGLFTCAMSHGGGYVCQTTLVACGIAFPCPGIKPGRVRDGVLGAQHLGGQPLVVHSITYAADGALKRAEARVVRGAAREFTFGRINPEIERSVAGVRADQALEAAVTIASGPIAVARTSEHGDGCALRVVPAGTGFRVVVRTVEAGRMGRVLVSDFVSDADLLLVPATVEGRAVVMAMRIATHEAGPLALIDDQRRFFDDARAHGVHRDLGLKLEPREATDF